MYRKKSGFRKGEYSLGVICTVCVLFLMTSGCTPLRKKFTRKKKEEGKTDQKFIPVLDPIDYPEKIYSADSHYKQHYSLWKVWNKDLLQVIELEGSDKRQEYLLAQAIEQLEEMRKWLTVAKQAELLKLIDELREVQQTYEKSASIRNKSSIKRKIERTAKKIRSDFSADNELPYREQ